MVVSPVLVETRVMLLKTLADLVIPSWVKVAIPLVIVAILAGGVLHYRGVVNERDRLVTEVSTLTDKNKSLVLSIAILEQNHAATVARKDDLAQIKKEVHAIPSSSLPADIQLAFDRLRERPGYRP